ncbi:hypothetical protein BASA81_016536 [Batrachochytrium salamandrivorans]|nr:hypothetical protein BASA81_016536 [Batrachochytrium salamandrivorans]
MNSAERNYEIYDKELLAIVDSFKHWRHFCKVVFTQSRYSATTKVWSTLCPRRSLLVDRLDGLWNFQSTTSLLSIDPGKLNGRADALSRQSDHHLENDCSNFKRILDPKQIIDLQSLISEMDLHVIVHSEKMASPQQLMFTMSNDQRLLGIITNLWRILSMGR